MFRSLVAAIVLFPAFATWAGDGLGQLHDFKDWVVGCDNTRRCEAQGYGREGEDAPPGGRAALIIRRESGPGQAPVLRFEYSMFDPGASWPSTGQTVLVQVGALRFRLPATAKDAPNSAVPTVQVPALMAAVLKGDHIRLSAGASQWTVSTAGAVAALLKMDDLQGRLGTPGALTRKGTRPESAVPAPALPVVRATPLPATMPADLKLEPELRATLPHSESDCPDFDPGQRQLGLVRLTPTTLLVLQPCWRGAYQTGSRVWQVHDRPPYHAHALSLPTPDGGNIDTLVGEVSTGGGWLELHEAAKGRGIGDCWAVRDWTWSGDRLVLLNASESPCKLFEAGGLMVDLWRARVEPNAAR